MRPRVPRWLGVAALIITAMKLGMPAFAQEFEPGEEVFDPTVGVIEETGEVIDLGVEVVDPGMEVVDPGVEVVDPGEFVDPPGEGTGPGGECVSGPPGLYQSDCQTPASDLMQYEPAYELWSDGAKKRRYIYLPPVDPNEPDGAKQPIDARNPDAWVFPVGTRLYKTFLDNAGSKKYETRIIQKESATQWSMTTYAWENKLDAEQKVAELVTGGVENVFGDMHDIPAQSHCGQCHRSAERPLGFSAIQLSVDGTLGNLVRAGLLINWGNDTEAAAIAADEADPEAQNMALESAIESYRLRATVQGDPVQSEALGYLHANCGHCHNSRSLFGGMSLFSEVLTNLPEDPTVAVAPKGIVGICDPAGWVHPDGTEYGAKVQPGAASDSAIIGRMSIRAPGPPLPFKPNQMPPLATEKVDNNENGSDGIEKITAWINSLNACPIPTATEGAEAFEAVF